MDWTWYSDANTKSLFIDLLINASYTDTNWRGIPLKRGQVVIGRRELSERLGITEQSIRTSIKRLKSTNEITVKSTNKFSIITVVNYNKYQSPETKSTNKLTNKLTNNQPATNQQLTTSNKYNKDNKVLISDNQKQIIDFWNKTYSKNYKPSLDLEGNISYWLKTFSLLEIKTAIANIKNLSSQEFWKNMRPTLFFRQRNKLGEADYIETALNAEKVKGNTSDELLKQIGL